MQPDPEDLAGQMWLGWALDLLARHPAPQDTDRPQLAAVLAGALQHTATAAGLPQPALTAAGRRPDPPDVPLAGALQTLTAAEHTARLLLPSGVETAAAAALRSATAAGDHGPLRAALRAAQTVAHAAIAATRVPGGDLRAPDLGAVHAALRDGRIGTLRTALS